MTISLPPSLRREPRLAGLALVILAALLYVATLDNGFAPQELQGGDLITHQYAQVQARPSNAPGYPLYTMGGWLWFHASRTLFSRLIEVNPIVILSLYSTLWALLALWLLNSILCFVTSSRYQKHSRWGRAGNWTLAWVISAFYAVTYFFWYYATTTEQYSSAIAQTLAIVYLWLLWQEADAADTGTAAAAYLHSRAGRLLLLLAFLCGLSLAHMLTVALIVPPLLIAVLWQRPALLRNRRMVAGAILAAALPLVSYLYVYLRGAAHPEWWGSIPFTNARDWFWWFVSTSQGRDELGWGFEAGRSFFANGFPQLIWGELSIPVVLGGLLGIAFLRRREGFFLYTSLALYVLFCWAYRYGNWYQVILPAYPLLLIGLAALLDRVQQARAVWRSPFLRAAPLALLALAFVWRVSVSLPQADSSNRAGDSALDRAALLLEEAPADGSLFGALGDRLALDYLLSIWGIRPGAQLVDTHRAADAVRDGRTLLSTWEAAPTLLAEMERGEEFGLRSHSPEWVEFVPLEDAGVFPAPGNPAAPISLLDGALLLEAWATKAASVGAPVTTTLPAMEVTLWWRLEEGWPDGVHLSLRPTSGGEVIAAPEGSGIYQADAAAPMRGLWPRAATSPLADPYRVPLPQPYPQAVDGLTLLLYRVSEGGFVTLDEVTLALSPGQ